MITWRFAPEMAGGADAACAWLAAGLGLVFIHVFLFVVYGGMSVSYLVAASRWFGHVGG